MNLSKINRGFQEIAFYTEGTGPYLLGLSGFGCDHYNFIGLVPELKKHYTIVLIDNRATGNSGPTNSDYKMKDLALDALAVMDSLNVKKFGVMGISMGGFISQELTRLAPERVTALALMCTTSGPPAFDHPKKLTEDDLRKGDQYDKKWYAEFMTGFTTHESLLKNDPDRFQRIVNLRLERTMDLEEKIRQNRAAVEFLETPFDLSVLKCPVYAIAGESDRFVSPESPAIFKKAIPHTQTELFKETDHYFFLEKPVMVAEKLHNFFQGKV